MPFTLAHPAAVLPLVRHGTPAALIAGTLAPDLPYFLALRPTNGDLTHSLPGLVITLPIALLLVAVWHFAIGPATAALSPRAFTPAPVRPGVSLVLSASVGILTHLVWDDFTHGHGYFVERIPLLTLQVWPDMPMFYFLQMGCSVIGLTVVTAALAKRYRNAPRKKAARGISAVIAASACTAAYAAITGMAGADPAVKIEIGLVRASVGATTGLAAALIIYGIACRKPFRRADTAP